MDIRFIMCEYKTKDVNCRKYRQDRGEDSKGL